MSYMGLKLDQQLNRAREKVRSLSVERSALAKSQIKTVDRYKMTMTMQDD